MIACRLSILMICSVLWPAILFGVDQPAAPRTGDLSEAIAGLGSPDFEKREESAKKIQAADLGALVELKAALGKTADEEVKERLKAILRKIQAAHPELLLKITLEGPPQGLRLEGDGEVTLKVWFENVGDIPVVVCQPVDGCFDFERDPKYRFALLNADGKGYAEARFGRCGNVNGLRKDDFVTLQPGEKVDLFERAKGWGRFSLKQYVGLKPGPHTLTLTYTMTSENKAGGIPLGGNGPEIAGLLNQAAKGTFVSAPLKLNVAPPMTTENLLAILNGKASDELSMKEAILALRDRKEPKAVEPLCKLLEHRDPQARQWAAFALGSFRTPPKSSRC